MSTVDPRVQQIIDVLLHQTGLRRVVWQVTDDATKFLYDGAKFSITVATYHVGNQQTYRLQILNRYGTVIQSVEATAPAVEDLASSVITLYLVAKRNAHRIDAELDAILHKSHNLPIV